VFILLPIWEIIIRLPWVCRTRGTTLKGLRRCLDVSAFPDATPLGLGRGVVLTQGSRFATTLGYDTQPLRGKEGNSSVAVFRAMNSVDISFLSQVEDTPHSILYR
ncbi:MAG: hypothetical protein BECKG1743F_GA0114225_102041, partial [Candidatus Kentron sp. G]